MLSKRLHFTLEEFSRRLCAIKDRMARQGIDVLLDADPANMYYATGFDAMSFFTPQMMIIALDADEPMIVTRLMDTRSVKRTAYIPDDNVIGWPEVMAQHMTLNPMSVVAEVVEKNGWGSKNIGIEMDAWNFTPRDCDVLKASLPNAVFHDARLLINWVRTIKSDAEISVMREAAEIQKSVMSTALRNAGVGVRECDLVAEIYRAQIRGTPEFGGDYSAYHVSMPTGDKAGNPHLSWTDEPLRDDQAFTMELGAVRHRYHTPMARTVYLGEKPPQTLIDTAEYVTEGFDATVASMRPGMTCDEANAVWETYNTRYRLEKDSRIAYAVGCCYPPVWQEKTASIRAGEHTILEPNMTFHMILGIFFDDWGYSMSETVRITETGAEAMTDFPRKLFVNPAG